MKRKLIIFTTIIPFLGCLNHAFAQHGFGTRLSIQQPVGDSRTIMNLGPGVEVFYQFMHPDEGAAVRLEIGYSSFIPKEDVFVYPFDGGGIETISYSPIKLLTIGASGNLYAFRNGSLSPFVGLGASHSSMNFEIHTINPLVNEEATVNTMFLFFVKGGLSLHGESGFALELEPRYTFYTYSDAFRSYLKIRTLGIGITASYSFY